MHKVGLSLSLSTEPWVKYILEAKSLDVLCFLGRAVGGVTTSGAQLASITGSSDEGAKGLRRNSLQKQS